MLHSTLIPLRRQHHSASMRAILNYLRWHAFLWPKSLPNNAAVGEIDTPNTLLHLLAARRARSRTGRTDHKWQCKLGKGAVSSTQAADFAKPA